MKTILVIVQLLFKIVPAYLVEFTDAQTIISFDTSPDNVMIMKIQDSEFTKNSDTLILIFDSTSVKCEFSDEQLIAFYNPVHKVDKVIITSACSVYLPEGNEKKVLYSDEIISHSGIDDEVEKEAPLSLEDWMLHPAEWN